MVAGAGPGISAQVTRTLADAGARVVCTDIDEQALRALTSEVSARGGDIIGIVGDMTKRDSVDECVGRACEHLGAIDVLVDVIGAAYWHRLLEITDEEWDRSHDVVLRHAFLLFQTVGRTMVDQGTGGSIVAITSISGHYGSPQHAPYGTFKAALIALTKSFALELGPFGVRVNAVSPGSVFGPRSGENVDALKAIGIEDGWSGAQPIPMRRIGDPLDIAKVVLFLCSDLAAYVSGQTLLVDGGVSANFPLAGKGLLEPA
jgi:3-oxoacyl-[acyl-carrier protein] reductase